MMNKKSLSFPLPVTRLFFPGQSFNQRKICHNLTAGLDTASWLAGWLAVTLT